MTISLLAAAPSLGGKISRLTLLGAPGELAFTQDAAGLHLKLPATAPCRFAQRKIGMPHDGQSSMRFVPG